MLHSRVIIRGHCWKGLLAGGQSQLILVEDFFYPALVQQLVVGGVEFFHQFGIIVEFRKADVILEVLEFSGQTYIVRFESL